MLTQYSFYAAFLLMATAIILGPSVVTHIRLRLRLRSVRNQQRQERAAKWFR